MKFQALTAGLVFTLLSWWTIPVQASPEIAPPVTQWGATVGGPTAPDGTQVQCDLPRELHIRNVGGSDGAGLCVMSSINMAGYWQNTDALFDYQAWARKRPGGGYPSKVDAQIDAMCKEKGNAKPRYIQVESRDLEILKLACKTGRMVSVTYGFSPSGRYGGAKITHMVNLLHADDKWFCVLDNNFPGTYEWMTPAEFLRAYTSGSRNGWAVILLDPGPPPCPRN